MKEYNTKKNNTWIKSKIKPKNIPESEFIKVCNESESMAQAASKLGFHYGTFIKYAKKYGCYKPNQSGKGTNKNIPNRIWDIKKWENDECIETSRCVIRQHILKLNLIEYKCNKCGINEWNGSKIPLELNHINGNGWEHKKSNIEWLCPNCHSQTHTFRGKNIK